MVNVLKARPIFLAALGFLLIGLVSCASGRDQLDAQVQSETLKAAEQLSADEIFAPERFEEILPGQSAATFKTSKPKCALYINGEYHGLTPLRATDLVPGRYFVLIKKEGFKDVNIAIQVKDGVSDYYYIEMEIDEEPVTPPQSQETLEL